jgi:hypothetical protein
VGVNGHMTDFPTKVANMFTLLTAADCLFQALVDFEADIRAPQTPSGQVDDPVNRLGSGEYFPLPAQPSYQLA